MHSLSTSGTVPLAIGRGISGVIWSSKHMEGEVFRFDTYRRLRECLLSERNERRERASLTWCQGTCHRHAAYADVPGAARVTRGHPEIQVVLLLGSRTCE
jgi:hypothetical protein